MSKKKKIQDSSLGYSLLRGYVIPSLFQAYRKIEYVGLDKIPSDGAIIYAPNHTNALMDALVVLSIDKKPKVFVARADIFRKKLIAKILTFLKIMPIMRIRDGFDQVKKNNQTIEKAVDVLKDRVPFCILPEGTHRAMHSLLPLSKGIFRIAISAQEAMTDETPIYIVPLGLEYGNFFRFRSTLLVQVGTPINVKDYLEEHNELSVSEKINDLKDILTDRLKDVVMYIPADENYDATYNICAVRINHQVDKYLEHNRGARRLGLMTRFYSNKETLSELETLKQANPSKIEKIFKAANEIDAIRKERRISLSSIVLKTPIWSVILKTLLLLITFPYAIPAAILSLPVTLPSRIILSKIKDDAFFNSLRFLITLIVWPLALLIYGIILLFAFNFSWQNILLIFVLILPMNLFSQDYFRLLRNYISDMKFIFNKDLKEKIIKLNAYFLD